MKVSVNNATLLKALAVVASVAERKQVMPILSYLYFRVKGNRITFIGSDTEVEVTCYLNLEGENPDMEKTLPARKFLNICRSFPSDEMVDITYENSQLSISCGNSSFELSSLPPEDFPMMEPPADEDLKVRIKLAKDELLRHLGTAVSCMARNDVRFYLNGVLFDFAAEDGLSLVATDGHRLALTRPADQQATAAGIRCIVPHKGVGEMMRLVASNVDKEVELMFYSNFLNISSDNFSYSCKLIDAPFPDYKRVIPTDTKFELIADSARLREGLNRCAIMGQDTGEKHHRVELQLSANKLKLFSTNKNDEKVNDEMEVQYASDDLNIKFNVFYLLDILNTINAGNVSINLTNENSSALIHKQDDKNTQFVVMPMKI